jgi:hypothetical protein
VIFQSTLTSDVAACAGMAKPTRVAAEVARAAIAAIVARFFFTGVSLLYECSNVPALMMLFHRWGYFEPTGCNWERTPFLDIKSKSVDKFFVVLRFCWSGMDVSDRHWN